MFVSVKADADNDAVCEDMITAIMHLSETSFAILSHCGSVVHTVR